MIWPWQDRGGRFSWLKAATFALMFAPALWVAHHVFTGRFQPFPLAGMTYWSGVWATALLLFALAITPAGILLRWPHLIVVRRMIGVTALVYSIGHTIIYFALRFWDFSFIANEMVTRISLIVATVALLGLFPLGVTSLDAAVQRMGAKGWQRLHNTVYVLTGLAIVHFLLSPGIYAEQYLMSGMFFWLTVWRALNRRGIGTDARALLALAIAACLFTMFLEAGWIWIYQGFEPAGTLANNFSMDLGLSAAWQMLIWGLGAALAAVIRRAPKLDPAAAIRPARNPG